MLRLEKLEMIGFKSFLTRTEFHFNQGITAVVGPNGCGKSNIADALNWVIGEQSVKSLRGDRMEDVIFNGSEARKPVGMAEVSLHLSNGAGSDEVESIVITRRLFRSGESEYLINGERSRLMDIQEALARINVGSGLYAIIEQGKVDAALSSKPRERRVLIEEAAGIALYKAKKRHAESKLEATEANLLRVNDIISEIEKQIGSLKRQAARARRYTRTAGEIARHERILLYNEHARLQRERDAVEAREAEARAKETEAAGRLALIEAQCEESRRRLDEEDALWRRQRDDLHALERALDHEERELALARQQIVDSERARQSARQQAAALAARLEETSRLIETRRADRQEVDLRTEQQEADRQRLERARQAAQDRIAGLEAELGGARAAFLQMVGALSDARNRRSQVEEAKQKLSRQSGSLEKEESLACDEMLEAGRVLAAVGERLAGADAAAAAMTSELNAKRAEEELLEGTLAREIARREESRRRLHGHEQRLSALTEVEATTLKTRDLLRAVAGHDPLKLGGWMAEGAGTILADGLKVPARLEAAAEAYLKEYLDAALVEGPDIALSGIALLKRTSKGRAAFLPAAEDLSEDRSDDRPLIGLPDDLRSDPGFVGRLGDLVETDDRRRRALSAVLARALVVTDLESACRLRKLAPFFDYVTLEGDLLAISGLVEGGARRPEGAGVLSRRRLKSDLAATIEAARSHLVGMDLLISGLESERAETAAAVAQLAREIVAREKDLFGLRLGLQAAVGEETRVRSKVETLGREQGMVREELMALSLELERLTATLDELEDARGRREAEIAASQEETAILRSADSRMGEQLSTVRSALSAARQRLEAMDEELVRLLETDSDLRDRIEREAAGEAELQLRLDDAARRQELAARAIEDLGGRKQDLEAKVKDGEVVLSELRLESERQGQGARGARGALEEERGRREQITLEKERVAADLRHLAAGALETAGSSIDDLLAAITVEEKALDLESVRASLGQLKEILDKMGPVNMMALDQFRELEERYSFLTAQRSDLNEAIASLKDTIARINRTSRERFLDAFEQIRGGFAEIFRSLFGGGRSDLKLMTGEGEEDVLECGIEIIAQPPGKRLQNISLLSGGEKALTAVALLFAIFKYRPSPFCLLDEVDAPLDEANVIRFNGLLKTMGADTQFVMITHNRCSMESADILYGITMEEPGVSCAISVVVEGETDRAQTIKTLPALLAARHKGNGRRPSLAVAGTAGLAAAPAPVLSIPPDATGSGGQGV